MYMVKRKSGLSLVFKPLPPLFHTSLLISEIKTVHWFPQYGPHICNIVLNICLTWLEAEGSLQVHGDERRHGLAIVFREEHNSPCTKRTH